MAILAGDALFLDPYALIAQADLLNQIKVDLIANLSLASGSLGMVAGQVWTWRVNSSIYLWKNFRPFMNKTGKITSIPSKQLPSLLNCHLKTAKRKTVGELIGTCFSSSRDDA